MEMWWLTTAEGTVPLYIESDISDCEQKVERTVLYCINLGKGNSIIRYTLKYQCLYYMYNVH